MRAGGHIILSTKDQDEKIFKRANELAQEINSYKKYYHTLNYNCLISSIDVVNSSGAGITIPTYNRSLVIFWMIDIKSANFFYELFPSLKPDDFPNIVK